MSSKTTVVAVIVVVAINIVSFYSSYTTVESYKQQNEQLQKKVEELDAKLAEFVQRESKAKEEVPVAPVAPPVAPPTPKSDTTNKDYSFGLCPPPHQLQYSNTQNGKPRCPWTPNNYANWPSMPNLCNYVSLDCLRNNPGLGFDNVKYYGFGISIADEIFFDFVMAAHQDIANITEFGTNFGVTALKFGLIAKTRKGVLQTFDIIDIRDPDHIGTGTFAKDANGERVRNGWLDNMEFYKVDLLKEIHPIAVESCKRDNLIVFFDNGSKKDEINMYAEYLAPKKTWFLTHDWNNEITLNDIQQTLNKINYEMKYEAFAEAIGSHIRAFGPK